MQKPIRYYITKDGEEPTVRSVEVALGRPEAAEVGELVTTMPTESATSRRPMAGPVRGVRRLVRETVRRQAKRR
jgi:hypothetical protein